MAKENAKKENNKNKKHFWKDFKAELKRVIWPTPKQLFKNTVAVIFIVIVTATIVFVLDVAFDALNTYGVNRLKSAVKEKVSVSEELDVDNLASGTEEVETATGTEEVETVEE